MKITFTKTQAVGKADRMIYGQFLEHFHRQVYGGIFDPESRFADEDGFRTDVIEAMKKIKVPIIRWPGGCFVSAYHWHYGVGSRRLPSYNKAWYVEEPNTFGTDEYIKFCRKVGCEPYICTNAGTGTAEEMSDWVEYCNLKEEGMFAKERIENGHREPYHVKYWSIGNENWGTHEIGPKETGQWGRLVFESGVMMQRVDPSIQLSAAALADTNWTVNLLQTAGSLLDWISVHGYWSATPDGTTYPKYEELVLQSGGEISSLITRARALIDACGYTGQIRIAVDEWNLRGWYHPYTMGNMHKAGLYDKEILFPERDKNDINSTYTMADAVFSACMLNCCLENCDVVGMACFSPLVNTRGAIYTYADGIVLRPQYYVFELYANLLKDTVLQIWREDFGEIRGQFAGADRCVPKLDVTVTYGDGEYAIAAVNRMSDEAAPLELCCIGEGISQMRIHTLNGATAEAYNDVGVNGVGIKSSDWQPFTGSVTLEPHSVNVIELK